METALMAFVALTLVGILIMVTKKAFWPRTVTLEEFNETRHP